MDEPGNLPNAQYRRFESLREYEAIVDEYIPRTQRIIRVFDKSLSRSWSTPQRHEALREFLLANRQNRLLIVLHESATIEQECARMVELVRQFSGAVRIHRTLSPARHVYDPFVVFDANHYVHRFHYRFLRAAQGTNELIGAQELIERHGEIWQASVLAVSAGTSGL